MPKSPQADPAATCHDFITGRLVPDMGAEANRQAVERILVEEKGYAVEEIEVDVPLDVTIEGQAYHGRVDLVVGLQGRRRMVIKCAAGSLDSRQREILAVARLLDPGRTLPLAVASNGTDAVVWDAATGEEIASGPAAIPDRDALAACCAARDIPALDERRLARERIVFRSYDSMNVNQSR